MSIYIAFVICAVLVLVGGLAMVVVEAVIEHLDAHAGPPPTRRQVRGTGVDR